MPKVIFLFVFDYLSCGSGPLTGLKLTYFEKLFTTEATLRHLQDFCLKHFVLHLVGRSSIKSVTALYRVFYTDVISAVFWVTFCVIASDVTVYFCPF